MKNLVRILLAIPVLWALVYPETGFWTCAVLWVTYAHIESLTFKTKSMMGLPSFVSTFMDLASQRFDSVEQKHGTAEPAGVAKEKCKPFPPEFAGEHCGCWNEWRGCCFCGGGRDVSVCVGEAALAMEESEPDPDAL